MTPLLALLTDKLVTEKHPCPLTGQVLPEEKLTDKLQKTRSRNCCLTDKSFGLTPPEGSPTMMLRLDKRGR